MKKLLSLLLCCVLVLSLPCAFAEEEKPELTVFTAHPFSEQYGEYANNKMTKYYEDLTGVHVNWIECAEEDLATQLSLIISSGSYPDVFACDLSVDNILTYANDVFIPLEDLIKEYAPNIQNILDNDETVRNAITAPDGHIYSLFRTDCGVHMNNQSKVYVNDEWRNQYLAASGKTEVATTEDLKDMLIYFRDNDMNGNGDPNDEIPFISSASSWAGNPTVYLTEPFQLSLHKETWLDTKDGKIYISGITDEFREGLKFMNELYNEGLLAGETFTYDSNQMKGLLTVADPKDQVVGCFAAAVVYLYMDTTIIDPNLYKPLAPVEGPTGLRQCATYDTVGETVQITLMDAISVTCEHPEVAVQWCDAAIGDKVYEFLGFENVNYYIDENLTSINGTQGARVSIKKDSERATGVESDYVQWIWNHKVVPFYSTYANTYDAERKPGWGTTGLVEGHEVYSPYYVNTGIPIITWVSDPEISNELNELWGIIQPEITANAAKFAIGQLDINDDAAWNKYVESIMDMGAERCAELWNIYYGM